MRGRARHGVLDARQRLVDGERVGDVLRSLRLERIIAEAADKNQCTHKESAESEN